MWTIDINSERRMKSACGIMLAFMLTGTLQAALQLPDHLRGPAEILHQLCINESHISHDTIVRSRTGVMPNERELQCYLHCMFDKVGLYDDAGNIDLTTIYHILPADFIAKLDVVTAKCMTIHGADKCETAYLTVVCYLDADPEVNISSWFDKGA